MGDRSRHGSVGHRDCGTGVAAAALDLHARGAPGCSGDAAQAVEPTALTADIPAEPLAQALEAFARQTKPATRLCLRCAPRPEIPRGVCGTLP